MAAVEPETDELRGPAAYSWFAQAVTGAPGLLDDATIEMVDSFGPDRLAAAVRPWFPDVAAPAELFIEIDTSRWRRVRERDWRRLVGVYRQLESGPLGLRIADAQPLTGSS